MVNHYTKEDVLRLAEEEDVEFIRLQFTDLQGMLKNIAITSSQLEKALDNNCMFDGSSIEGFVRIEESDMYLYPQPDTFQIFPWRPQQGKVARMICDVYWPDRKPFEGAPRYILKKVVEGAKEKGFILNVGMECEFFLFHLDDHGNPTTVTHEQAGFFDVSPLDQAENVRRDIMLNLQEMGYEIETSHHEIAPGQHEIDFRYNDALSMADDIMTFKMAVKTIAQGHGLHATFMPKPLEGVNGSGMHINMSLTDLDGKNLFASDSDPEGLSPQAYHFMAGILEHIDGITAIANPLVNSYKRLVSGFDAPAYRSWSSSNRSPLIRIPATRGEQTRLELRSPDPSANPYLALAVCLAAGLDGMRRQLVPPASINKNIYHMTDTERDELGIQRLPSNLGAALDALEQDELLRRVLGSHAMKKYVAAKRQEWNAYCAQVDAWEISRYLRRY